MGRLRRLRREFGFYSIEVVAEEGLGAAGEGMAYVLDGTRVGDHEILSSGGRYDALSGTWSELAPMKIARYGHGACAVSGELAAGCITYYTFHYNLRS